MPGDFNADFNTDFSGGVILVNMTGLSIDDMQILAYTSTQKLLWDFSNTQDFYLFQAPHTLYRVSPVYAYNYFNTTQGITQVYSPFSGYARQLSNLT